MENNHQFPPSPPTLLIAVDGLQMAALEDLASFPIEISQITVNSPQSEEERVPEDILNR